MLFVTFKCRECGKRLFVKGSLAGYRTQCPRCYKYLAIPLISDKNYLRILAVVVIISAIVIIAAGIVFCI